MIYVWRNHAYSRLRNALFIVNTLGLVGYLALPTAPPRRRAAFAIGVPGSLVGPYVLVGPSYGA